MKREGHRYVKPVKRTTAPARLLVAIPEYDGKLDCVTSEEAYYTARAVWVTDGRRYGTRWVGSDEPTRYHPDDWWDYVSACVRSNSRLYIVSDNACDLLTVTGFWVRVERGEYRLCDRLDASNAGTGSGGKRQTQWVGRLVMGGPPDIIHVRHKKGSVICVSMRNYTTATWERLRSAVTGSHDGARGRGTDPGDEGFDPSDKCTVCTRYTRSLISEWVRRDCGPWKETVAQLSLSLWRKKFYTHKVCRHADDDAIRLERDAAHGGRAETWYYGDAGDPDSVPDGSQVRPTPSRYPPIQGTVYRCDVSAQYPALLASQQFPVRLMGVADNPSVADLSAMLRYYGVIAHVDLHTRVPEYPTRRAGEACYPVGTFATTLAGPELERAMQEGCVCGVRKAAYYELGYPLRAYAAWLLQERADCRGRDDYCGELFAKSLATAIGGKFSQRTTRREPCPTVVNPFSRWGPYTATGSDGVTHSYLTVGGLCFEEVASQMGSKLLSALYCYLTSYGRVQMARLRESLLPVVPYSQCTDGIWVGVEGRERLSRLGLSADRIPGTLRLESSHSYARWLTPNHYYVDGYWTLSGYRMGAAVDVDGTVMEYRDYNPVRTVAYKPPMSIRRRVLRRDMAAMQRRRKIGPDGWLIPQTLRG